MTVMYMPQGVCSRLMRISLDPFDRITAVEVQGGCNGNLTGLSALVKGMDAREVIEKLSGTRCGDKATSCPDQLCRALEAALAKNEAIKLKSKRMDASGG